MNRGMSAQYEKWGSYWRRLDAILDACVQANGAHELGGNQILPAGSLGCGGSWQDRSRGSWTGRVMIDRCGNLGWDGSNELQVVEPLLGINQLIWTGGPLLAWLAWPAWLAPTCNIVISGSNRGQ